MKRKLAALLLVFAMLISLFLTGCGEKTAQVLLFATEPIIGRTVGELTEEVRVLVNEKELTRTDEADDTYGGGTQFTVAWMYGHGTGWSGTMEEEAEFYARDPAFGDQMYYEIEICYAVSSEYTDVEYEYRENSGNVNNDQDIGMIRERNSESELSADGKWRIFTVCISFSPNDAEDDFAIMETTINNPPALFGVTVREYAEMIGCTLHLTGANEETEDRVLTLSDSAQHKRWEDYENGTKFTFSLSLAYSYNLEYSADEVLTEDLLYGADKFKLSITYAAPAEYKMSYVNLDNGYLYAETVEAFDETDEYLLHDLLIFIPIEAEETVTEGSLYVPQPVFGETVAETNEKITFILGDTPLTYTDSTDYENPETYADGTRFIVDWTGNSGEEPNIIGYEPDHVFAEEDVPGGGLTYARASVYYAAPVGEKCIIYVGSDIPVVETSEEIRTEKDGWAIHELFVMFESGEEPEGIPEVELQIPALYYLTTPIVTNQEIGVSVNGNALAWTESIKDPETDFFTNWSITDSTDFTTAEFTNPMSNYLFNGSGEIYVVRIYFNTPYVSSADLSDGYELSYEIEEGGDFDVEVRNVGGFASNEEETYMSNGVDVIYTQKPGHVHNMEEVTGTAATCTENGTSDRRCTVCGARETLTVEALGHSWGAWTETITPTCISKGARVRTCSRCGAQEAEQLAALGHSYTYTGMPGNKHTVTCSRCGVTFEEKCTFDHSYCIYCGSVEVIY